MSNNAMNPTAIQLVLYHQRLVAAGYGWRYVASLVDCALFIMMMTLEEVLSLV